jgi:hypothetical protein
MARRHQDGALDELLYRVGGPRLIAWHHKNDVATSTLQHALRYKALRISGVESSLRIYLDTNFWIGLRDAELGRNSPVWRELLNTIRHYVRSRDVVCVTQEWSFYEIATQRGESLRTSARIIDELCEGVSIAPTNELRYWDVGQFVAEMRGWPYDASAGRWTWIGQILKSSLPKLPADLWGLGRQVVEKSCIDAFYNLSLSDLLAQLDWNTSEVFGQPVLDDSTIALLESRREAQRRLKSTREAVRRFEFRSLMREQYGKTFLEHVLRANDAFALGLDSDEAISQEAVLLVREAVEGFDKRQLGRHLPEAAILTELYTEWERDRRRLTRNEYIDWQIAAAALPLCNLFLTDKHLADRLRRIGASKTYNCEIASTPKQARDMIDSMMRERTQGW